MTTQPQPWDLAGLTTDQWQAIGSFATAGAFFFAAAAVVVAWLHLRHNRAAAAEQLAVDRQAIKQQREHAAQTALDRSRPYVLLSLEPSPVSFRFLDLVIENSGAGPAFDVGIQVDPPLRRAKESPGHEIAHAHLFQEAIPMLPPRYRLRTFLDSVVDRNGAEGSGLPNTHMVTIEYHDGRGNRWREQSVLDMTIYEGLLFREEYGVHHAAEALREIKDLLKRSKTLQQSPIEVAVETRAEHLDRVRAEQKEPRRRYEELVERMRQQSERKQAADEAD